MSIAHRSVKTPEQIRKEVIDDLVDSALVDARFLRQLVAVYVDKYSEEQIRQMWVDAGLDELEDDDDQD
jgi:hypothetical protein